MSRRCGSWLLKCSDCGQLYKLTNFMYRTYEEVGTGIKLKTNTHKLKHLQEQGKVVRVLEAGETRRGL
jgi:hypothetical protein